MVLFLAISTTDLKVVLVLRRPKKILLTLHRTFRVLLILVVVVAVVGVTRSRNLKVVMVS